MKTNKLIDLNDRLFMQLDRLGNKDLTKEELQQEIGRTNAMEKVSKQILDNARVGLQAQKMFSEGSFIENSVPEHFAIGKTE